MSAPAVPGLFVPSTSQSERASAPASQPAAGAADSNNPTSSAPKTSANYLQDKDLTWWLTFARTFKSAVKTPLPDDDSDL